MTIVTWLLIVLFSLKLVWNLGVPWVLINRLRTNPQSPTSRISMSTSVEVILLLLATGAATVNSGIGWINRPIFVFGLGITCIVFTYIHLVVVGAVGGWIISRKQQPPSI